MKIYWIGKSLIPEPYDQEAHAKKGFMFLFWKTETGSLIIVISKKVAKDDTHLEVINLVFENGLIDQERIMPDIWGIIENYKSTPYIMDWFIKEGLLSSSCVQRQLISSAIGIKDSGEVLCS